MSSYFQNTITTIHENLSERDLEILWKNLKIHPELVIFYLRNKDFKDHPVSHKFLLELLNEKERNNISYYSEKHEMEASQVIQWYLKELRTFSVSDLQKAFLYLLRNDQSYHVMAYLLRELQTSLSEDDFKELINNGDIHYIIRH